MKQIWNKPEICILGVAYTQNYNSIDPADPMNYFKWDDSSSCLGPACS
ncbi:MAG: hypothetical protein RR942_02185 [Romboutsia sp.]